MIDIFVSYARKDQEAVNTLKPTLLRLAHEQHVNFFQDVESIAPGEEWECQINDALQKSTIVICFLSNSFFSSAFIQNTELPLVERAYEQGKTILCILVERTPVEPNHFLSKVQWVGDPKLPLDKMDDEQRASLILNFYQVMKRANEETTVTTQNFRTSESVRYNIVVVGKAGVGKSQLINYLLGKELLKTGIGSPVTLLGFHRTDLIVSGINTSIWDSAGLEVGKHEDWMHILNNELRDRAPTEAVSKWFHTVLYCVQGPGSRIEPFEVEIINRFLNEHYRVIIVITKSFIAMKKLDELSQAIRRALPQPLSCVYVNSKSEKLITDQEVPDIGKATLIREIQIALIESLTDRIPLRCIKFMEQYLDEECSGILQYTKHNLGKISKPHIADHIELHLKRLTKDITSPRGKFHHIILRETRLTLGVYREIAGLVEEAMSTAEETAIVSRGPIAVHVTDVSTFWSRFESAFDEFYDWDLEKSWGEIVDVASKIATFPVALIAEKITTIDAYDKNGCNKIAVIEQTIDLFSSVIISDAKELKWDYTKKSNLDEYTVYTLYRIREDQFNKSLELYKALKIKE